MVFYLFIKKIINIKFVENDNIGKYSVNGVVRCRKVNSLCYVLIYIEI